MIIGMVEREGGVIAKPLLKINQNKAQELILENVDIDQSEIHTDEYQVYNRLKSILPHKHVNHGRKEYVRGNVHTNSIEGFWSLVKRAYYGQHHHYSKKYTGLYVAEAAFKYNHRKNKPLEVFTSILGGLLHV